MKCSEKGCVWPEVQDSLCFWHLRDRNELGMAPAVPAPTPENNELRLRKNAREAKKQMRIAILRDIAKKLGRTPSAQDMRDNGLDPRTLAKTFGGYRQAILAAGLEPRPRGAQVDTGPCDWQLRESGATTIATLQLVHKYS